ncbi:Protein transport protein Sec61 subunit beta [Bulinus truncatus]|nr:Protein transport protein Sec61 subunit beta [Bulinus truncatus]
MALPAASSTTVGGGGRGGSSKSITPRSSGTTARQRKPAASSTGGARKAAGSSAGMWRFYTEDSPGIKVGPVPVLVMSLIFIASVFMLHIWGKYTRS